MHKTRESVSSALASVQRSESMQHGGVADAFILWEKTAWKVVGKELGRVGECNFSRQVSKEIERAKAAVAVEGLLAGMLDEPLN